MNNFTIRIYQGENTCLSNLRDITISNITLIRKDSKHQMPYIVNGNASKFGYKIEIKGKFLKSGGSVNYPCLSFKGKYIDIEVKDFPRYPCFTQESHAAKNCLNGWGYTNHLNQGYPIWLLYRKCEIIKN